MIALAIILLVVSFAGAAFWLTRGEEMDQIDRRFDAYCRRR